MSNIDITLINNKFIPIEKLEHTGDDYVDISQAFEKINEIIIILNDCIKELDRTNKVISNPFLCSLHNLIK